jgi:hypothetical protein
MPFEDTLIKPLSLLATAFKTQGEYKKSINLNLYLIDNISNFYKKEKLLENKYILNSEKVDQLLVFLQNQHYPYRRIMKALFTLDLTVAWKNIDNEQINCILDILWFLPSLNLNADIISKSEILTTLYLAKGELELSNQDTKSDIFSIDTIISAKKGGCDNIDLLFNYGCGKCKNHFPISFTRCPKCYAIDAIQVKETLVRKQAQTSYSLL